MNGLKCLLLFLSLGQSLNYSIIIQYNLLLCHPFKVLSISQLLTTVLKLMSLVLSDLRLKTQFMKVSEMEIQVLNLEN